MHQSQCAAASNGAAQRPLLITALPSQMLAGNASISQPHALAGLNRKQTAFQASAGDAATPFTRCCWSSRHPASGGIPGHREGSRCPPSYQSDDAVTPVQHWRTATGMLAGLPQGEGETSPTAWLPSRGSAGKPPATLRPLHPLPLVQGTCMGRQASAPHTNPLPHPKP